LKGTVDGFALLKDSISEKREKKKEKEGTRRVKKKEQIL
jgi:hypothetical protein